MAFFSYYINGPSAGMSRSGVGNFYWRGRTFNPCISTDCYAGVWDAYSGYGGYSYTDYSLLNAFTSLDVGSYYPGDELVMMPVTFYYVGPSALIYAKFESLRPDGSVIYSTNTAEYNTAGNIWYAFTQWCGIGMRDEEIGSNFGAFNPNSSNWAWRITCYYNTGGGYAVDRTTYFYYTISNFDTNKTTIHSSYIGRIWVAGEYLCYVDGNGYKHTVRHDGSSYGSPGVSYSGRIWQSNNTSNYSNMHRIFYVDQSGIIRRTKKGCTHGANQMSGWQEIIDPGASYCGRIFHGGGGTTGAWDTYLILVDQNGLGFRIGNGSLLGDYQ